MNLEQRQRQLVRIRQLEGLLAYAEQHGEAAEAARLRAELVALVEQCEDGVCCI